MGGQLRIALFCAAFTSFTVWSNAHLTAQTLSQAAPSSSPSAHLDEFDPSDEQVFTDGQAVDMTADVSLIAGTSEDVEYFGILTVNGQASKQFDSVLLAGTQGHFKEHLIIPTVKARGRARHMKVQFQLAGIGRASQMRYDFDDMTRNYLIKCNPRQFFLFRLFRYLFGLCS